MGHLTDGQESRATPGTDAMLDRDLDGSPPVEPPWGGPHRAGTTGPQTTDPTAQKHDHNVSTHQAEPAVLHVCKPEAASADHRRPLPRPFDVTAGFAERIIHPDLKATSPTTCEGPTR